MNALVPQLRQVALAAWLVLVLALAPAAVARSHGGGARTLAPPGNSSVSQYVETVPTGGGGRPTSTLHPGQGSVGGSGGGGQSGGGTRAGGSIPTGTAKTLVRGGPDGAATVALARATASPSAAHQPQPSPAHQPQPARQGAPAAIPVASPQGDRPSPLASLVSAVIGSGSGNALGPLVPIILIATLVGSATAAIIRRRSTS